MEVDTGASVSIMSENRYKLWTRVVSQIADLLKGVVGSTDIQVVYEGLTATLPLVVVKDDGPPILGRNWLTMIRMNWDKIHYMRSPKLHELQNLGMTMSGKSVNLCFYVTNKDHKCYKSCFLVGHAT